MAVATIQVLFGNWLEENAILRGCTRPSPEFQHEDKLDRTIKTFPECPFTLITKGDMNSSGQHIVRDSVFHEMGKKLKSSAQ